VSVHSRAARRAASPSIDVDKSILSAKAPEDETSKSKFLGVQNAGISKKKKAKPMTRQQRLRQEKGMERADANSDKLATKLVKSFKRAKAIDVRRVGLVT